MSKDLSLNNNLKVYILKSANFDKNGKIDSFLEKYKKFINPDQKNKTKNILEKARNLQEDENISMNLFCYPEVDNTTINVTLETQEFEITSAPDAHVVKGEEIDTSTIRRLWVNSNLYNLRACPLIDYTLPYFILQEKNKYKNGIPDVVNCQVTLSTKNQSTCNLSILNDNFKYNLGKDIRDYRNYLQCVFDTWDIVIVRAEKRKKAKEFTSNFTSTFKNSIEDYKNPVTYFKDPYAEEDDGYATIFTGYINNVNHSYDYNTGTPTINISCTGPSKKMEWIRLVTGQATAPQDASAAIIPLSAYTYPQTIGADNKPVLKNEEVVKNVIQKTLCGVENNVDVFKAKKAFYKKFNENITLSSGGDIWTEINNNRNIYQTQSVSVLNNYVSTYPTKETESKFNEFTKSRKIASQTDIQASLDITKYYGINIYKNAFLKEKVMPIFLINGTSQPAYQMSFNNYSSIWSSSFSTVYQFINDIANRLQFNFYDDPYGTIRFEVLDFTLEHLHSENSPYILDFVINYSETQNIDAYSSVLPIYGAPLYSTLGDSYEKAGLSAVYRDEKLIKKYGEKMMNPLNVINYTDKKALSKYAKNYLDLMNRKIEKNMSFTLIGNPEIFQGKCAYFPDLLKLFYIETVQHNWSAGGTYTTTVSGGYTREILGRIDEIVDNYCEIFLGRKSNQSDYVNFSLVKNNIHKKLQQDQLAEIRKYLDGDFLKKIMQGNAQNNVLNSLKNNLAINIGDENSAIRDEILEKYSYKNLVETYLDGYFWDVPVDVYPYETCLSLQEQNLKVANLKAKNKEKKEQLKKKFSK